MKYLLFILFLIGGLCLTTGIKMTKKGSMDRRFKGPSLLVWLIGILSWGLMIALAMIFGVE